jgi:serine phosphatase RsbU (regulator of sigma subunit)
MTRFPKTLLFFLLLVSALPSFAQDDRRGDSLKAILEKEQQDTTKVNIYNTLADYYRYRDKPQHQQYSLKAIQLAKKINFSSGLASGYNMYGQYLENTGKYEDALLYYDSAGTRWGQMGDEAHVAHMYLNSANVYNRMGNYPAAADYTIRALKKNEKLKNTFGVAACNLTLGNIYYQQDDIDGALAAYKKAFVLNRLSNRNVDFEGAVLGNIGAMYEQKENHFLALHYIRMAAATYEKNGMRGRLPATYNNLGTCFRNLSQYDSAIFYGRKGLQAATKAERPESVANAYLAMGVTEEKLGSMDSAMLYFTRGLSIATQIGARDLEANFYDALSAVYEYRKDYEKAYFYSERYSELYDSLHGIESTTSIQKLQQNYEIDKKNILMAQVKQEQIRTEEAAQRNLIFFICGAVLLLGIIVTIIILLMNKQKSNLLLERKNDEISQQKEEITASITYARRIQQSVMPDERILQKSGYEYFILNKPRDIVSGDFFWLAEKNGKTYIAVADCTGHGVPGALVSVIGVNILNKIIEQPGSPSPSEILELLHVMMIQTLNKDADARDTTDGMDIALLCIDKAASKANFAGAGRPLYHHDGIGLHVVKGNRYSVAAEKSETDAPFTEVEIPLLPGTTFYMSSDGYADQFGEATGKKFLSKNFHELLSKVAHLPIKAQANRIDEEFLKWKGNLEQVDDVLVLGIKI